MNYNTNLKAEAPTSVSLMDDSNRLGNRLGEIAHRVRKIADTLHGPVPQEVAGNANAPAPTPTIRRNIDDAHDVATIIEHELARIEGRL